eukprot:g3069.t1
MAATLDEIAMVLQRYESAGDYVGKPDLVHWIRCRDRRCVPCQPLSRNFQIRDNLLAHCEETRSNEVNRYEHGKWAQILKGVLNVLMVVVHSVAGHESASMEQMEEALKREANRGSFKSLEAFKEKIHSVLRETIAQSSVCDAIISSFDEKFLEIFEREHAMDNDLADDHTCTVCKGKFVHSEGHKKQGRRWVQCENTSCEAWGHASCFLYDENHVTDEPFHCPICLAHGNKPVFQLTSALSLQQTKISKHIEHELEGMDMKCGGNFFCRVLYQRRRTMGTNETLRTAYAAGSYPESITYVSRTIGIFADIDGFSNLLFIFITHEFDDDCEHVPNRRMIYLAYVDSVGYIADMSDQFSSTHLFHTCLNAYAQQAAEIRGMEKLLIWSCAQESKKDERQYIFYCKSRASKNLSDRSLLSWYQSMYEKGVEDGIYFKYEDFAQTYCNAAPTQIAQLSSNKRKRDPKLVQEARINEMPICAGDFWSSQAAAEFKSCQNMDTVHRKLATRFRGTKAQSVFVLFLQQPKKTSTVVSVAIRNDATTGTVDDEELHEFGKDFAETNAGLLKFFQEKGCQFSSKVWLNVSAQKLTRALLQP